MRKGGTNLSEGNQEPRKNFVHLRDYESGWLNYSTILKWLLKLWKIPVCLCSLGQSVWKVKINLIIQHRRNSEAIARPVFYLLLEFYLSLQFKKSSKT